MAGTGCLGLAAGPQQNGCALRASRQGTEVPPLPIPTSSPLALPGMAKAPTDACTQATLSVQPRCVYKLRDPMDCQFHQGLAEAGRTLPLSLWPGCGPADTLTSDFGLQNVHA